MVIAVIADIVDSRRLHDRVAGQRQLDAAIARVERRYPLASRPLRPTFGDEQQAVHERLESALITLLLIQLALPDELEFRFGIGVGESRVVPSASGELFDGSAWYAAREAIDIVHERKRTMPSSRTWIVGGPGQDEVMPAVIATSNAYLALRDETVARMSGRERRLALGRVEGLSQRELADQEGISQPSVSKALRTSGAVALLSGLAQLQEDDA